MARKPKPHVHGRDHEHGGADTTLIHYEDVGTGGGGGGGGLPTFANTGQDFSSTTDDLPLILDTPDGVMHFYSSDPATFDSSGGRARILRPGMYLIGCQLNISFTGTTDGIAVWLKVAYEGGVGTSIEVPYYTGGYEEVRGTRFDYVAGVSYSDTDIGLQRLHPISLTDSTTFPLEIQPTCDADVTTTEALTVGLMALWGFRLGDPLDSYHSD